jgi:hypothetical protein
MRTIQLFNHVDDAWESGLRDWFRVASSTSLEGNEKWFVVRSLVQANWLRQRCLRESITLFGVKFFDPRLLRRELCKRSSLPSPSFGRETLRLLVQATLDDDPSGHSLAEHLISALDELASVGWVDAVGLDTALARFPINERTRHVLRELVQSEYWRPRVDRLLRKKAPALPIELGIFGLGTFDIPDLGLIEAAALRVSRADIWLPQAIGNESSAFEFVTRLETAFGCQHIICPDSSAPIPYGPFIGRWAGLEQIAIAPEIVVSDRWSDQTRSIVELIEQAIDEGSGPIAVIVPESSSTGSALLNALSERDIPFADEFRQKSLGSPKIRIQKTILEFLNGEGDGDSFLLVVEALIDDPVQFRRIRKSIFNAFEEYQERSIRKLPLRGTVPDWLIRLIDLLEPWQSLQGWEELGSRWQNLLRNISALTDLQPIQLGTEEIEPLWHEIVNFIGDRPVSAKLFFSFLQELFSGSARTIHPGADHRYSKIIITTARKALGCSWDVCILTDSTTSGWPLLGARNPLLDDRWRLQLRDDGFLLPTANDRRQGEIDLYLQLIHQTRRRSILTLCDRDEKGDELIANDLVTFSRQFLGPVDLRYMREEQGNHKTGLSRFADISLRRRNPVEPFDEWFLNFSRAGFRIGPWSPSMLERAIQTPATFAFRQIFGSEREWHKGLFRDPRRTIGILVHRILSDALGGRREIERVTNTMGDFPEDEDFRGSLLRQVRRAWESERIALPPTIRTLWWESVFDQILLIAELVAEHLVGHLDKDLWIATEHLIEGECAGEGYRLLLAGRTDLLLVDQSDFENAIISVFDIKTGKSPQSVKLADGEGLQFLGYQLLLEQAGAAGIYIYQSRVDQTKQVRFGDRRDALPFLIRLSEMQRNFCFGQMPPARSRFEKEEVLPISSLSYPAEILTAKRTLTEMGMVPGLT